MRKIDAARRLGRQGITAPAGERGESGGTLLLVLGGELFRLSLGRLLEVPDPGTEGLTELGKLGGTADDEGDDEDDDHFGHTESEHG